MVIKTKWDEKDEVNYYLCSFLKCKAKIIHVNSEGTANDHIDDKHAVIYCAWHAKMAKKALWNMDIQNDR